jgi:flagellar hook-associated protein 2
MSNFKKMMDAFEERLYKKYDTMEATLAKLGSQLNYITGGAS